MEKKIKVAGYVRVSTPLQAEEGESIDTQKKQITDYVAGHPDWELVNIYCDEGATASKLEFRYEFQKLVNDAKAGLFKIIVFTKLSRFARNARDYQNLAFELSKHGVNIVSIKENIDPTNSTGKLIAGMIALIAEWELENIREQMYENKMARWEDKRIFVGLTPFGYQWNNTTKKLEPNPEEAEVYQRIVKMYTEQGMAMRDIALQLNKERVVCTRINKKGKVRRRDRWYSGTVSYILKNPAYYGYYVVNQFVYEDDHRGAGKRRTKIRKPESEAITFETVPLISKPEWDKIQETTEFRKIVTKRKGKYTSDFYLRNVLKCGRCGSKMNLRIGSQRKDGTINRYYVCYYSGTSKKNLESRRTEKCTLPFIHAEAIEAHVWSDILMKFVFTKASTYKKIFDHVDYEKQIDNLRSTIVELETELKGNGRTYDRLMELLKRDDYKYIAEDYSKMLRANKEERFALEGSLAQARLELKGKEQVILDEERTIELLTKNKKQLADFRKQLTKLSLEDRRLFIEASLKGPIVLDYQELNPDYPEDGEGPDPQYSIGINTHILQRFVDEGKLKLLNPNTSLDTPAPDSRGGPGDNQDPLGGREDR